MRRNGLAAKLLADLLDGTQLSCGLGQTSGSRTVVEICASFVQGLLSSLDGSLSGGFIQVSSTLHGVGKYLDHVRLNSR